MYVACQQLNSLHTDNKLVHCWNFESYLWCDIASNEWTADAVREYCQLETFSARCRHGDVIVMTTARFGRMRVGKCIDGGEESAALEALQKVDPNSIGCYADVLDYADRTCSGKTACDIFIPNRDLLSTRPCLSQLTMYFEAAFHCVSGQSHWPSSFTACHSIPVSDCRV